MFLNDAYTYVLRLQLMELWGSPLLPWPLDVCLTSRPRGPSRVVGPREVSRSRVPRRIGYSDTPAGRHPIICAPSSFRPGHDTIHWHQQNTQTWAKIYKRMRDNESIKTIVGPVIGMFRCLVLNLFIHLLVLQDTEKILNWFQLCVMKSSTRLNNIWFNRHNIEIVYVIQIYDTLKKLLILARYNFSKKSFYLHFIEIWIF